MKTAKPKKNLGLCRTLDEGGGVAVSGRGARIVVRAWRKGGKVCVAVSAPEDLAIQPAERIEEEEGLLPGELRGGTIPWRAAPLAILPAKEA